MDMWFVVGFNLTHWPHLDFATAEHRCTSDHAICPTTPTVRHHPKTPSSCRILTDAGYSSVYTCDVLHDETAVGRLLKHRVFLC